MLFWFDVFFLFILENMQLKQERKAGFKKSSLFYVFISSDSCRTENC